MAYDALKTNKSSFNDDDAMRPDGQSNGSGWSHVSRSWPWLLRFALTTVAVLVVHLAFLNSASLSLNLRPSVPSAAFTTRTILPAPTVPEVVPPPPRADKVNNPAPAISKPKPVKPPITPAPTVLASTETTVAPATLPENPPETIQEAEKVPALPPASSATSTLTGDTEPAPAFAAPLPAKYIYNVTFTKNANTNKGTAELNWQHDGANYQLSLTASYFAIPVFIQNSVGQLAPQGLLPTRFSDKRLRKSEVAAHFNHLLGKITFSANTPDAVLLAGVQDRVSVILQLAGLLAADPAKYSPGATLNLQTVSATEAATWLFTVNEPETLNLPAGPQLALRITRNPRREFDQKVELWFAPELNHAPVRFRFTETNGDYVDAQLQTDQYLSPLKSN